MILAGERITGAGHRHRRSTGQLCGDRFRFQQSTRANQNFDLFPFVKVRTARRMEYSRFVDRRQEFRHRIPHQFLGALKTARQSIKGSTRSQKDSTAWPELDQREASEFRPIRLQPRPIC